MAVKINFNEASAQTHTSLVRNERAMNKSLLRLSTGTRILNAADDSAGLFIADMLGTVAKAYDQGNRNIQTGISALQIAEASTGQIFDKLQEIYVRAQNAANDVNDPNARLALQQEIRNFVDAIQKIGTDTEYNGIKLLDGTFKDKFIHYGARLEQTVYTSIDDVRAQNLGAHLINTNGNKASGADFNDTSFRGIKFNTAQTATIGDRVIKASAGYGSGAGAFHLLDAGVIANEVNLYLGDIGFKAKAVNVSVGKEYTGIADVAGTADLTFYVGEKEVNVTGLDTKASLDTLIEKINRAAATAGADLSASRSGNSLVLTSSQGYTIGLKVQINTSADDAKINIDQLINDLDGKSKGTVTATTTGLQAAAAKVGDLYISRDSAFTSRLRGLIQSSTSSTSITPSTSTYSRTYASGTVALSSLGSPIVNPSSTTMNIFGNDVASTANYTSFKLLDYGVVAKNINSLSPTSTTSADGSTTSTTTYSATASNTSSVVYTSGIATVTFLDPTDPTDPTATSAKADLTFYVGGQTISVTGLDLNTDLSTLVDKINSANTGGASLTAARDDNNHLILFSPDGNTIGLDVKVKATDSSTLASATIHLDQLLGGADFKVFDFGTDGATEATASAVLLGSLTVTRTITSITNSTTTTPVDLELGDFVIGSNTGSQFKNLYSVDVTTNEGAEVGMLIAETALRTVDNIRAQIGATMNNLQSIFDSQKVAYDNTKEAESVIRNTDYAKEMSEFTTYQIRMQATVAMLAQANTLPQLVLQLLR
jgi:flagellin